MQNHKKRKSRGKKLAFLIPTILLSVALVCSLAISLEIVDHGQVIETQSTETRLYVESKEVQFDKGVFILNHDGGVKAFPESITRVSADPRQPSVKHVNVIVRKIQINEGVEIFGVWFINPNVEEVTTSVIFD